MKTRTEQISIEEMRDELRREVAMRKRVYPRWVEIGKLSEPDANLQMLKMSACLEFIELQIKRNDAQGIYLNEK